MNFRLMAGICLLLLAAAALPVSALTGAVSYPAMAEVKSGIVWVTLANVSGTEQDRPVKVVYAMGDVVEIDRALVIENTLTGVATVTVKNDSNQDWYVLDARNAIENDVYAVYSVTVSEPGEPLLTNHASFAVVPETANYYVDTVPEGKQHEWIDLDWKDPARDLNLTIYAPDQVFGPYSDTADGRKDGRIFLDIASRLNVTAGNWFFRVQNNRNDYTPYTLNTYSA